MGKIQLLVVDREVVETGHISTSLVAKLSEWTVAIVDDGNFNSLPTAIAQMQSAMIKLGLSNNGFICNDRLGKICYHVYSTTPGDEPIRTSHPLHENKNCQDLIGLFCRPNAGILQHIVQHHALQKIPLECFVIKLRGKYLITHQGHLATVKRVDVVDGDFVVEKELLSHQGSDFRNDCYLWESIAEILN
jgi:hypothetical protein